MSRRQLDGVRSRVPLAILSSPPPVHRQEQETGGFGSRQCLRSPAGQPSSQPPVVCGASAADSQTATRDNQPPPQAGSQPPSHPLPAASQSDRQPTASQTDMQAPASTAAGRSAGAHCPASTDRQTVEQGPASIDPGRQSDRHAHGQTASGAMSSLDLLGIWDLGRSDAAEFHVDKQSVRQISK